MLPYSIHTLAYYSFAIVMLCVEKSWKPSVQIISVSNEGESHKSFTKKSLVSVYGKKERRVFSRVS
jgi:hypothetical protein